MAARATWKGYLKISLVNIPIKVFPATESSGSISFNQLHAECQTRIQQKKWCPHCEREVPNTEIVKGFEFEKGRYVIMSDEDLEKVRPESTRVIDLVQFADAASLDPMYVDRTYYLAPDGGMAADAFAVMRDGMQGKVGIGKLALYGREYLVAVRPFQRGIVMHTLHHAAEMRGIDSVDELNSVPATVKPEEMKLARQVIQTFEQPLNLADYKDEYRDGPAADHRREDRRRGGRRHDCRGAAEGRQPDGGAEEEPRRGERGEEEEREGRCRQARRGETQAGLGIKNLEFRNLECVCRFSVYCRFDLPKTAKEITARAGIHPAQGWHGSTPTFEGGQDIRDRSFEYACEVVGFCQQLSEGGGVGRLMVPQLLNCSLSFATMLEEARSAESDADFISKCCIGLKECQRVVDPMRVVRVSDRTAR